uniref:Protein Lines homolog 1 n=1 Tax=Pogona vitticeps TaxID=103695 RepID=A0A6J0SR69_9SAUR
MHEVLLKILDFPIMETLLPFLGQIYDDVLVGAALAKDSHECAALLTPHFPSKDLSTKPSELFPKPDADIFSINDKREASEDKSHSEYCAKEIILLQLTLIRMILNKVQSRELAAGIKQKYLDIIRILLKEANIDTKLIYLLCSSDKQLSHMASKSLVSLIYFQLTEEGSLNSAWLAFASETLLGFPSSRWLAECLWAFTDTVREALKEEGLCKKGDLKVILSPLDKILEGIYNSVLSYYSDLPEDITTSPKVTNGLSSFLDLLELLVASRIHMPLNYSCQRMMFLNAACVLELSTAPVHYLIKKKSIMLLKKCILQKAGEDVIKKKRPSPSHEDPHFDADRLALAGAVLQFVNSGWLNRLSVSGKANHFGGSQVKPEVDIGHNSDQVTLRALSLLLLKALEIKVQDSSSEADIQVQLESVMGSLLRFLKKYLRFPPPGHLFEHPCLWVSVLFIEQDDDLLEAAKALLTIHLKLERFQHAVGVTLCHSDGEAQDILTHRNGCNPHCIFLFLLKSIAFDASVLLDFLISFETCFLEYFVRYLKLLVEDWHRFAEIAKHLERGTSGDSHFSLECLPCHEGNAYQLDSNLKIILSEPQSYTTEVLNSSHKLSSLQPIDHQMVKPSMSNFLPVSDNPVLPGSLQRLVDYESSEDSEPEWVGENHLTDANPMSSDNQTCSGETLLTETDDQAGPSEEDMLNVPSPSHCKTSPNNSGSAEGMLRKAVTCFQELQYLISRLHGRNLFPYNPSALLKLLVRVDTTSKKHLSISKRL